MNCQPLTLNPQPSIHLHIERFVVDEPLLASGQRDALQASVEAALLRLLKQQGLPEITDRDISHLSVGDFQLPHHFRPGHLGERIVQTIWGGLSSQKQSEVGTL
jgi:hypothetical protein